MMDIEDVVLWCFGVGGSVALIAAVVVGLAMEATDAVQERRAFDAATACEAKQMIPRRKSFSARVVCVPAIQRQDTATVRVEAQ